MSNNQTDKPETSTQLIVRVVITIITATSAVLVAYFQFWPKHIESPGPTSTSNTTAVQTVEVRIIDAETKDPVPGAIIFYGKRSWTTSQYGIASISIDSQPLRVQISAHGYKYWDIDLPKDGIIQIQKK